MRTPRRVRLALAAALIVVSAAVGGLSGRFLVLAFTDPSPANRSGFLGTILGGVALILGFVPVIGKLLRDPATETLLAAMQRRQRQELSKRFETLRHDEDADIQLRFEESGSGTPWDTEMIVDRLEAQGRLVVLGAPGSGKSYSAIQIALRMLMTGQALIPVIVPLSRWRLGSEMNDWLAVYVAREFNISRRSARSLVGERHVLPVFDAVEEIQGPQGDPGQVLASFMEALLTWQEAGSPAPFLVTARTAIWSRLDQRHRRHHTLTLLSIRTITPADAAEFVSRALFGLAASPQATTVLNGVGPGPDGNNLQLSWRLAMIVRAAKPLVLPDGSLRGEAPAEFARISQPDELVKAFVLSSAFPGKSRISRARSALDLWQLSVFARYLSGNNVLGGRLLYGRRLPARDIEPHRIWPIAGAVRPRVMDLVLCVALSAPGLLFGFLLLWGEGAFARVALFLGCLAWFAMLLRTSLRPWVPAANWAGWQRLTQAKFYLRQVGAALVLAVAASIIFSPEIGLGVFATSWLVIGFSVGFGQTLTTDSEVRLADPSATLRYEHRISRIAAWAMLPLLSVGLSTLVKPVTAVVLAAIYCFIVGETVASALWRRYIATILSAPLTLPWFPLLLLRRARRLGLVRSVGLTYQFRHDEVRDYLASRTAGRFSQH